MASIDGSHDGVRTRASPKLIITPKRIELALRLALGVPLQSPIAPATRGAGLETAWAFLALSHAPERPRSSLKRATTRRAARPERPKRGPKRALQLKRGLRRAVPGCCVLSGCCRVGQSSAGLHCATPGLGPLATAQQHAPVRCLRRRSFFGHWKGGRRRLACARSGLGAPQEP